MKKSTQVAIGGLSAALCLLMMFMTGLIPFSSYVFPAMAGIVLIAVEEENGHQDRHACLRCRLGARHVHRPRPGGQGPLRHAARLLPHAQVPHRAAPRPIAYLLKFLLFNGVIVAFYYVMLYVFGIPDLLEGWGDFGKYTIVVALALVNFTLFMYDFLLSQVLRIYRGWFRPKILRKIT